MNFQCLNALDTQLQDVRKFIPENWNYKLSWKPLGGIDGCLLVEPPALVLVFIYQARLNAIYTAKLS